SAREGYKTPTGLFAIYSKATSWDLGSRADSDEPYYIESVPWVMHYYPRYALHSAFWHADFGLRASHGCINLSPKDMKYIFELSQPILPNGWWVIRHDSQELGSPVRIRYQDPNVPDKRLRK
ncbi:MAG: L,D-transpeptidase, partial [Myxococcota bacterium]|nr:L,D-transpeptidase [Myxococcota bacterium]